MLSPRFLRLYAGKCRRSAKAMNDPKSIAELEAMARDFDDWANDPAGPSSPYGKDEKTPNDLLSHLDSTSGAPGEAGAIQLGDDLSRADRARNQGDGGS